MIAALELDAEHAAVRDAVAAGCRDAGPGSFEPGRWRERAALGGRG